MKMLRKAAAAAMALSLAGAPVAANAADASKLSVARAGAQVDQANEAVGGGILVAVLAAAAVIVGIIIVADSDDDPDSP